MLEEDENEEMALQEEGEEEKLEKDRTRRLRNLELEQIKCSLMVRNFYVYSCLQEFMN